MKAPNAVGWFDIYVDDIDRAARFYEHALDVTLAPMVDPTGETHMMAFPTDMEAYGAGGALVQSPFGRPAPGGTLVYFSVRDCAVHEPRVITAGGKVVRPKFSIGQFGWVTLCMDTEGNMFGMSSQA